MDSVAGEMIAKEDRDIGDMLHYIYNLSSISDYWRWLRGRGKVRES